MVYSYHVIQICNWIIEVSVHCVHGHMWSCGYIFWSAVSFASRALEIWKYGKIHTTRVSFSANRNTFNVKRNLTVSLITCVMLRLDDTNTLELVHWKMLKSSFRIQISPKDNDQSPADADAFFRHRLHEKRPHPLCTLPASHASLCVCAIVTAWNAAWASW